MSKGERQTERRDFFTLPSLFTADRERLDPPVYTEMVSFAFATLWPVIFAALGYCAVSVIVLPQSGYDPILVILSIVGSGLICAQAAVIVRYHHLPAALRRNANSAAEWERRYAIGGFAFSVCLGLLTGRVFQSVPHVAGLGVALLYAYSAGIGARLSMRPRIAIGCVALAMVPAIIGMSLRHSFQSMSLVGFTIVYVFGIVETISHIYKTLAASLGLKHEFAALARYDELTGLPNRLQTRERLNHEIARVVRQGGLLAVHYLDLDHFKKANDLYGHAVGDALLQQVARRLLLAVRAGDTVGRLSGDEFLVVQTGMAEHREAECLAKRIIATVSEPFQVEGFAVTIGTSIGIALAPADATDMTSLINCADSALYLAKAGGRSGYVFHKAADGAENVARLRA